jgi:hypothetical protein
MLKDGGYRQHVASNFFPGGFAVAIPIFLSPTSCWWLGLANCGSLFGCSRLAILSKHVYSNFTPYPVFENLAELSHCNMEASSSLAALSILVQQVQVGRLVVPQNRVQTKPSSEQNNDFHSQYGHSQVPCCQHCMELTQNSFVPNVRTSSSSVRPNVWHMV